MIGSNQGLNLHVISTILASGNYTLWFWDWTASRLPRSNSVADPFSFELSISQVHGDETFVSCNALSLPSDWNQPGLIDETGFMSFREDALLNLDSKRESATFRVTTPSLFRAWAEPHRIDVDLELLGETGRVLGRTYQGQGIEESLVLELQPNRNYTFAMRYFTTGKAQFCETLLLEIMIKPLAPLFSFNPCQSQSNVLLPAFPDFDTISTNVVMPSQNYLYYWTGNHHIDVISQARITLRRDMQLTAILASSFIEGISLQLRALNGSAVMHQPRTQSSRNEQTLRVILMAGSSYVLTIRGGPHQYSANQTNFSRCAVFSFFLNLEPIYMPSILPCPGHPALPTDLSVPKYFGSSNQVHFQDSFRILFGPGLQSQHTITFRVRARSLFRAYTEPRKANDVEIEFSLFENGMQLVHPSARAFDEEKITSVLLPDRTYTFEIGFFANFLLLRPCATFNLEVAIVPISGDSPVACSPRLPPPGFMIHQNRSNSEFSITEKYIFEQSTSAFIAQIPLIVESSSVFARVLLSYDFVWSDLSVRILSPEGSLIVLGENDFNKNQILPLRLPRGTYTIQIFEPAPFHQVGLHRCVSFEFMVRTQSSPISFCSGWHCTIC